MQIKNNTQKKQIQQKMIKANIYDDIKLYVDIRGMIDEDFKCINSETSSLFQKEKYSRYEDGLSEADLQAWNERTDGIISPSRLKSLLNNEKKVIYASNDGTEKVILSKLFICVELNYKAQHSLTKAIQRIQNISELYSQKEFVQIERVTLEKNNSILCSSIYRLYQCFDKSVYGDICSGLELAKTKISEYTTENIVDYDEYNLVIRKKVLRGTSDKKECYYATLGLQSIFQWSDEKKVCKVFEEMNQVLFKVFINNITVGFCNDLMEGKSDKVMEGVNANEM